MNLEMTGENMTKIFQVVVMCVLAVSLMACSNNDEAKEEKSKSASKMKFHGEDDTKAKPGSSSPYADALKPMKLNANSSKTIGEAFDSYSHVVSKEWRDTEAKDGKVYVDYLCQLDISKLSSASVKDGVVKRDLIVKFVIHEKGEAYIAMATRVEVKSDGKSYTIPVEVADIKKIVDAIYANKEISF